jgi:hypothetical protein
VSWGSVAVRGLSLSHKKLGTEFDVCFACLEICVYNLIGTGDTAT